MTVTDLYQDKFFPTCPLASVLTAFKFVQWEMHEARFPRGDADNKKDKS